MPLSDLFPILNESGLNELEVNTPAHRAGETGTVARKAVEAGFICHFHAPYPRAFPILEFGRMRRGEVEDTFRELFDLALECAVRQQTPCVINLHGASARSGEADPLELRQATREFLGWAVGVVGDYPVRLALEVALYEPGLYRIGQFGGEIADIVRSIAHPALGLGLDMGHCAMYERRRGMPYDLNDDFIRRVIHVHLHDIDEDGQDHGPLIYGRVDYPGYLQWLARRRFGGAVILEFSHANVLRAGPLEEMIRISARRAREAWAETAH